MIPLRVGVITSTRIVITRIIIRVSASPHDAGFSLSLPLSLASHRGDAIKVSLVAFDDARFLCARESAEKKDFSKPFQRGKIFI